MLETHRLILRLATLEDAPLLYELNSDPEVVRFTGDSSFTSMLDAQNIIRDRMIFQFEKYKMSRFMVFLRDGTFIGWCGLKNFPETNEVDLGYRFMKIHWGKGYATEASEACLKYGFEILNLPRIIAKAMPDNTGSIKVMQKLGMSFRGYVKDPTDPQSFILYELLKKDYEKCAES
jgi:ribosomal-protein-alanine N-acetyltransferase